MQKGMRKVVFQCSVPVRHNVDIFIAGGGPAGVAAAVAAAREGRKVFLAEGQTCFGGMGTAGLVPVFCCFGDGVNFLAGGFGAEIYERLWRMDGIAPGMTRKDAHGFTAIRVETLKRLYDEMVMAAGVDFSFQTQVIGVEMAKASVKTAICSAKSGLFAVQARIFIDGTGDGDLAVWAGAKFEKGDERGNLMPGTLCSLWSGIDWKTVKTSGIPHASRLPEAFKDKVFSRKDLHLPGVARVGNRLGGGNIGHAFGVDGTDERSISWALVASRKLLLEYECYYKKYLKGFENMELTATGSLLGIRETRRIHGDYTLKLDDYKRRAVFEDEIGRYCYTIDVHPSRTSPTVYRKFRKEYEKEFRYKPGESYGIPFRVLLPRGLKNVLTAGRCVSADRYVHGSIRAMPGCFITGQSAGMAAAITVENKTDLRGIQIRELQRRLKRAGAFLPNYA